MPDLEYKIVTTKDGSGATETARDIDQLNKTAQEGTESVSDLGTEAERASEKTGGLKIEARGLHSVLSLIARESGPAVGAAVAGAASLMTGGLLVAVLAAQQLLNWIHQLRQQADSFRDEQAALWVAVQKGSQDAADAAQTFADKLQDTRGKSDDLNASFTAATKVLEAQIEDHKKILKAVEAEQLAMAKGDPSKEAAVRQRFAAFNQNYDLQAEQTRIEAERAHRADMQIAAPFLGASASGIEYMLETAKEQNAIAQEKLADAGKGGSEEKLKAAALAVQPHAERFLQSQTTWWQEQGLTPDKAQAAAAADVKNDPRFKALVDLQTFEDAKAAAAASARQVTILTDGLTRAQTARDENTNAIQTETDKINEMTGVHAEHRKAATAGGEIETATGIADRLTKGEVGTPEESQFLIRLAQAATGHVETLAEAAKLFEKADPQQLLKQIFGVVEQQNAGFTELWQRVRNLESRHQSSFLQ